MRFQTPPTKRKSAGRVIYVFAFVTLISLAMLPFSDSILHITKAACTPALSYSVDVLARIKNFKDCFVTLSNFREENIRLAARISELEHSLAEMREYNEKISRLELLLDIKSTLEAKGRCVATGRASVNNNGEFVINKGTKSGIAEGNAVIGNNGLAGSVAEASDKYSVIKTILNKDFEVCVRNVRSGLSYVAYGCGSCMGISDTGSGLCNGDIIETSGADGLPEGICVGEVQGIYQKGGKTEATIKPCQSIRELYEIIVVADE